MKEKGFTLIETIIYIAIISIAMVSFISFSLSVSEARNKTYTVEEVQSNARVSLQFITQRIMAAAAVNVGASTFGTDPGVLSLAMADAAKNPTIISLNNDDGTLQIKEGLSAAIPITSDRIKVTNLVFTNLTSASYRENIRVQFTSAYKNTNPDVEFNYAQSWQTAVSLRQ
ncbi:prepilin-type N-terminal cleavage/methylation domain-containing protein [Patescibacteria group bacterium]|nr:prepilin-type N-terminal cleavage/methylation domain-containing protein [Patescibacteria group bacterium]